MALTIAQTLVYISQDIHDIKDKPYLLTALTANISRATGEDPDKVKQVIKDEMGW